MNEKEKCKTAIRQAMWASRIMPGMFTSDNLLHAVCNRYGTEFVAECLIDMGVVL